MGATKTKNKEQITDSMTNEEYLRMCAKTASLHLKHAEAVLSTAVGQTGSKRTDAEFFLDLIRYAVSGISDIIKKR